MLKRTMTTDFLAFLKYLLDPNYPYSGQLMGLYFPIIDFQFSPGEGPIFEQLSHPNFRAWNMSMQLVAHCIHKIGWMQREPVN